VLDMPLVSQFNSYINKIASNNIYDSLISFDKNFLPSFNESEQSVNGFREWIRLDFYSL